MRTVVLKLFISLLVANNIYSQEKVTPVEQYYNKIHLAEIALCKGKLNEGKELYQKSIANNTRAFYTDLNNAIFAEVNSTKPDLNLITSYLNAIQHKGVCVHKKYKDHPKYALYLKQVNHAECNKVKDVSLASSVEKMYATDQVLRNFSADSLGEDYALRLMPAIEKIDSVNFDAIHQLLSMCYKNNLPLEEQIGCDGLEKLFVILLHNGPWGRYDEELLRKMVLAGLIDNRLISFLFDNHCNGNYRQEIEDKEWKVNNRCNPDYKLFGTGLAQNINQKIYIVELKHDELLEVNSNRKRLLLFDVYEEAKVKAFVYFNLDNGLYYPGLSSFVSEGMDNRFEKNYQGYKYIKYSNLLNYNFNQSFSIH